MTDPENKQYSILIIDDEESIFEVIEGLLYREGYKLSYINSGEAALKQIDDIQPMLSY